ncbi:hypothetical protein ACHAWF_013191, partial [Thalassiosira exigua]
SGKGAGAVPIKNEDAGAQRSEERTMLPNGGVYTGPLKENTPHGLGKLVIKGSTYTGDFVDGKFTGSGELRKANGEWYKGKFLDRMKHGIGECTFRNGDEYSDKEGVYEGNFANNLCHGQGTIKYSNGEVYEGGWAKGNWHGKGVWKASHFKYEGHYVNGECRGKGKMTYPNGDTFFGSYKDPHEDEKDEGLYTFHDGEVHEGKFVNGKAHGWGKHMYLDGSCFEGNHFNDHRCGKGKHKDSAGNLSVGTWSDGKRHGKFIYTCINGNVFKEIYDDGNLISRKKLHTRARSDREQTVQIAEPAQTQPSSSDAHVPQLDQPAMESESPIKCSRANHDREPNKNANSKEDEEIGKARPSSKLPELEQSNAKSRGDGSSRYRPNVEEATSHNGSMEYENNGVQGEHEQPPRRTHAATPNILTDGNESFDSHEYEELCVKLTEKVVEQRAKIKSLKRGRQEDDESLTSDDDIPSLQMKLIAKLRSENAKQKAKNRCLKRELARRDACENTLLMQDV